MLHNIDKMLFSKVLKGKNITVQQILQADHKTLQFIQGQFLQCVILYQCYANVTALKSVELH